jgi:hypothetical protein
MMQGILSFISITEGLGAIAGLAALLWACFHHTSWPPVYLFASAGFYLVVLSAAVRVMQMSKFARRVSVLVQLSQLVQWNVSGQVVGLLAGPQLTLVWTGRVMAMMIGAGGWVRLAPPPAGVLAATPELAWSTEALHTASTLFSSFQLNTFSLAALAAIGLDVWLDRRKAARARREAADLATAEAPHGRLRAQGR